MHPTFADAAATGRRNNFDAIRLVLALSVLLSHSWPMALGSNDQEPFSLWTGERITLGGAALHLFFVISGYLITKSWAERPGLRAYIARRARRILPGYCLAWGFGLLLVLGMPGVLPASARAMAIDFVLVRANIYRGIFPSNPMPGVLLGTIWSLRYEEWLYAFVALLGMAGLCRPNSRVGRVLILGLLAVALVVDSGQACGFWLTHPRETLLLGNTGQWPHLSTHFLAGAAIYLWRDRILISGRFALALFIIAALVPIADDLISPQGQFRHGPLCPVVWPLAGAYIVLYCAYQRYIRLDAFRQRLGGEWSYGTYLLGWPIQQLLIGAFPWLSPGALFAASAALTLLAASASWRFVESRFLFAAKQESAPEEKR